MKRMVKVSAVWLIALILSLVVTWATMPETGRVAAGDPLVLLLVLIAVVNWTLFLAAPVIGIAWCVVLVRWMIGGPPKPVGAVGFAPPPAPTLVRYKLVNGQYVRDDSWQP